MSRSSIYTARLLVIGLRPKSLPLGHLSSIPCACLRCGRDVTFTPNQAYHRLYHEGGFGCYRCSKGGAVKAEIVAVAEECGFHVDLDSFPADYHGKTKIRLLCATPGCDGTAYLHYNQMKVRLARGSRSHGCVKCSYMARRKYAAVVVEEKTTCAATVLKGPRKGQVCGRPSALTSTYCAYHDAATQRRTRKQAEADRNPCGVKNCPRPAKENGYCGYHRREAEPAARCSREGCERLAHVRGFCASDHVIWLREGMQPLPPVVKVKVCEHCGVEFEPSDRKQKYCTPACGRRANRPKPKPVRERTCDWCGATFTPKVSREMARYFCSNRCRNDNRASELRSSSRVIGEVA